MQIFLLACVLTITCVLAPLHPSVRRLFERATISTQFVYTMIATGLGVYLSIYATNLQKESADLLATKARLDKADSVIQERLRSVAKIKFLAQIRSESQIDPFLLASLDTSFIRVLISGEASLMKHSHEFMALAASLTGVLDSKLGYSSDTISKSQSEESFSDFAITYSSILGRLLVSVAIEREYLEGGVTAKQLEVLYRCGLDTTQAPMTEKWAKESGCDGELSLVIKSLPKNLVEKTRRYESLYKSVTRGE